MKKTVFTAGISLLLISLSAFFPVPSKSFYDLKIRKINSSDTIDFSAYKGKKILCVNTASECGFTAQYEALQQLSEKYKDRLVVIAFPCNQFGGQEPGSDAEIQKFCKSRYKVTFPVTEKIDVKPGDTQHDVYQWLTQKRYNKVRDVTVRWNFGKFLIDEKGKFMAYFPSQTTPMDSSITALIEKK